MIIPNFGSLCYYTYDLLISIHAHTDTKKYICSQKPQVCDCYKCLIGEEETFWKDILHIRKKNMMWMNIKDIKWQQDCEVKNTFTHELTSDTHIPSTIVS